MSAQSKLIGHLSVIPSPGRIIIGYLLGLLAATAGVALYPFSNISMGLFFVTIGAFALVAVPVLVMVYLFLIVVGYRALNKLGRRLLFDPDHGSAFQGASKSFLNQKHLESHGTEMDLWDRWIDGAW
jgi:hypothetical protein